MVKYEYRKVPFSMLRDRYSELSLDKLNEFGAEGWQLVTVISGEVIFKRKLEN
jgi:hypothetical protein